MSLEYMLWLMATDKPRELICYDSEYNYYGIGCLGYWLMYRQQRLKNGRRCYYLTDELARLLGYEDLHTMKLNLSTLQYWRRFVSVERLRIAIEKYHQRQQAFAQMAANYYNGDGTF